MKKFQDTCQYAFQDAQSVLKSENVLITIFSVLKIVMRLDKRKKRLELEKRLENRLDNSKMHLENLQ